LIIVKPRNQTFKFNYHNSIVMKLINKKRMNSFIKRRVWPITPKFLLVWYLSSKNSKSFRKGEKLVPENDLEEVYVRCLNYLIGRNIPIGDYLEFGVYHGSSMVCMNKALERLKIEDVRLIGFDSFEGLPMEANKEGWSAGQYCISVGNTKKYLSENRVDLKRTKLVKGWFSDTLTKQTRDKYKIDGSSIIMVDCDIYTSTIQVLDFIEPLMGNTCVLVFDDWKSLDERGNDCGELGQKRAFKEFLAKFPCYTFSSIDHYGANAEVFLLEKSVIHN
jgi:O-methyltransferase